MYVEFLEENRVRQESLRAPPPPQQGKPLYFRK